MNDTSFLKSYLKGEASYGFWNLVSRSLGAVNTFIVIGALTLYEYGSFQLLLASYAGVAVLLNVGGGVIRNDIFRLEAEGRSSEAKKLFHELFILRIATALALWAGVFFFAPLLSFKYGPDFILLIRIMSFVFLHDAVLAILTIPIEMRKRFNIVANRLSIAKFSQFVILVFAIIFYRVDLQVVVVSLAASLFVSLFFLLQPFKESYLLWKNIKRSGEKFLFKILRAYGKWEVAEPIVNRFTAFFETWAIKLFISTEAVAIYSVAQMMISTISGFLPVKTLLTLVPMEMKDEEKLRRIYTRGVKYLTVLVLVMGAGAFFVAPIIINIFFAKYVVSLPYFKALILTLPLHAVIGVSSIFLISMRRQKFLFFQKVLKVFVVVPLYLLLLPMLGLWGLVIQNYIFLVVSLSVVYIYFNRMQPRLFIGLPNIISFDESDRIFLRNVFSDIKNYLNRKFSTKS